MYNKELLRKAMGRYARYGWLAVAPGLASALSGCGAGHAKAKTPAPATGLVTVGVVTPVQGDVAQTITQPATIQGIDEAVIHAKTSGYLKEIRVDKGDRVKAGQLLALIDSPELAHQTQQARATYEQSVVAIQGAVATRGQAEAEVREAATVVQRYEADARQAEAAVVRARAEAARVESRQGKLQAEIAEADANVQQAMEQQAQAQAEVGRVQQQIRSAQAALKSAQSALTKAEAEARLQQLTYNRLKAIQDKDAGLVPAQDVDVAKARMEASRSEVEARMNRVEASRGDLAAVEQQLEAARRQVSALGRKVEAVRNRAKATREEVQILRKEIEAARAQVAVAEAQQESARKQVAVAEAQRQSVAEQVPVTAAQVNAARKQSQGTRSALDASRSLADYIRVTAPFDGVVTERMADPGAFVQSAASNQASARGLVRLVRDRTLRVLVPVPETDSPQVRRGQPATIAVDAYPGKEFRGTVTRFATAVDPRSRTMTTEIDIPNPDGRLRPGMYARVTLTLTVHRGALSIPSEAVMGPEDKRFVYTVKDGQAQRTLVTVGVDNGKTAQITTGLAADDQVVVVGRDTLVDGVKVKSEPVKSEPAKR